jgi:hypothetical protein
MLLYCIAESSLSLRDPATGVAGLPVVRIDCDRLAAFVSESPGSDAWTRVPLRQSAVEFHGVLHKLFDVGPIIPFRFPTILQGEEELTRHVQANSDRYGALLAKFRSSVQMEALISYSGEDRATKPSSGAAYLRDRQKRLAELKAAGDNLRRSAEALASAWHCRAAEDTLRCFALIERGSIGDFKDRMRTLAVPQGFHVRITGPWPVTEFLELRSV